MPRPIPLPGPLSQGAPNPKGSVSPSGGSHRGCTAVFQREGILFLLFPNPESKGRSQTYFRPMSTQQIFQKDSFAWSPFHYSLPGYWYATLNLRDVYFHVAKYQGHRKFLRFIVKHSHYHFTVLPFCFSAVPQVFTKCMSVVVAFLRRLGVQVYPYLTSHRRVQRSGSLQHSTHPVNFQSYRSADQHRQIYPLFSSVDRVYRGSIGC